MAARQVSNKKNMLCLIASVVMLLTGSTEMLLSIFYEKRKWPSQNIDLLFLLIGIVGIIFVFISIVNIRSNIEINKYLKNPAYGLDYQKEFSTYKIIGKEKSKAKNGALKFHKYSEWREYIEEAFGKIINDEDAYRFIVRRQRSKESYKELILSAIIPIEVGMFTALYAAGIGVSEIDVILPLFGTSILFIIIVTVNYLECKEELCFISDFIEIVFPKKSYKK